jgi:hypothetical protein
VGHTYVYCQLSLLLLLRLLISPAEEERKKGGGGYGALVLGEKLAAADGSGEQ